MTKFNTILAVALSGTMLTSASAFADEGVTVSYAPLSGEITNIQLLSGDEGAIIKNGIRFDRNERRLALKAAVEERIQEAIWSREDLAEIFMNKSLDRQTRVDALNEYRVLGARLGQLYKHRAAARTAGLRGFEELEEFYVTSVSVS